MNAEFVIDLSRRIIPEKENTHFKCVTHVDDVTNILPHVIHRPDIWYILGEITMCTHVGTHIEVPYHHWQQGADTADFPVHKLIAPGVMLDYSHKEPGSYISLDEIRQHDGRIRAGDFVFIRQGADVKYYTEHWTDEIHLSIEANKWLIEKKVCCIGTDATGVEVPGTDYQPNHVAVCEAGIPMIESLVGLERLGGERHLIVVLPLPVEGLDASPLRVVAIKKEGIKQLLENL